MVSEPGPRTVPLVRLKLWTVEPSVAELSLRSPLATVTVSGALEARDVRRPSDVDEAPGGRVLDAGVGGGGGHAGRPVRRAWNQLLLAEPDDPARGAGLRAGTDGPGPLCVEDRQQHDQRGAERCRTAQQGSPTTSHDASHGDLRVGRETRPPDVANISPGPVNASETVRTWSRAGVGASAHVAGDSHRLGSLTGAGSSRNLSSIPHSSSSGSRRFWNAELEQLPPARPVALPDVDVGERDREPEVVARRQLGEDEADPPVVDAAVRVALQDLAADEPRSAQGLVEHVPGEVAGDQDAAVVVDARATCR